MKKYFVKIKGGLGNQMFQYAFIKALSLLNSCDGLIDLSFYEKEINELDKKISKHTFQLDNFNISLNKINKRPFLILIPFLNTIYEFKPATVFDINLIKKRRSNKYYIGYFQNESYFKEFRSEILKEFTLKTKLNEHNTEMLQQIKQTNSVSVHVRRGDYLNLENIFSSCSLDYYQKSIEYIVSKIKNPHFYLFSNDIEWVTKNLRIDYPFTIVDINDADTGYYDLELMKNCKHNIIANSSFSWWGAWLNENPNKIVVTPKEWYVNKKYGTSDINCVEWVKI